MCNSKKCSSGKLPLDREEILSDRASMSAVLEMLATSISAKVAMTVPCGNVTVLCVGLQI